MSHLAPDDYVLYLNGLSGAPTSEQKAQLTKMVNATVQTVDGIQDPRQEANARSILNSAKAAMTRYDRWTDSSWWSGYETSGDLLLKLQAAQLRLFNRSGTREDGSARVTNQGPASPWGAAASSLKQDLTDPNYYGQRVRAVTDTLEDVAGSKTVTAVKWLIGGYVAFQVAKAAGLLGRAFKK